MDSSGSIRDANPLDGSYDNWEIVKDFAAQFAQNMALLTVEGGETRIAVVRITRESQEVSPSFSSSSSRFIMLVLPQLQFILFANQFLSLRIGPSLNRWIFI